MDRHWSGLPFCLPQQTGPQGPKRPVYRLVGWEQVSGVGQAPISASLVVLDVQSSLCLQVAFRKTARWPVWARGDWGRQCQ